MPPVLDVKGSLPPRSHPDFAAGLAVDILGRQASQGLRPLKNRIEVAHDKVESFRGRVRLTNGRQVDDLKRDGTAGEVAARARLHSPGKPEQLSIELCRFVEIPYFDVQAEEARYVDRRGNTTVFGRIILGFLFVLIQSSIENSLVKLSGIEPLSLHRAWKCPFAISA